MQWYHREDEEDSYTELLQHISPDNYSAEYPAAVEHESEEAVVEAVQATPVKAVEAANSSSNDKGKEEDDDVKKAPAKTPSKGEYFKFHS